MLTKTTKLLTQAEAGGYAIGGFNVYNLEGVQAVIKAGEAEKSPVLLQIHPSALKHGGKPLIAMCLSFAEEATVPVGVHLDHSTAHDELVMAVQAGVTSVMADGSHLATDANVAFVRKAVDLAHAQDIAVEGELGRISGTEDGLTVADFEARMTDPDKAISFVAQTGIDALAICIGNVHGRYPFPPQLDFERLKRIKASVDIPLVLHGASGLGTKLIKESIALGIRKFNVNTEVRRAYLKTVREQMSANPDIDLLPVMQSAQNAMQVIIQEKLQLFGSSGQA